MLKHIIYSQLVTVLVQLMNKPQDISVSTLLMKDRWLSLQCETQFQSLRSAAPVRWRGTELPVVVSLRRTAFLRCTSCLRFPELNQLKSVCILKSMGNEKVAIKYDLCLVSTLQANHLSSLGYKMNVNVFSYFLTEQALRKGTR